MDLQPKTMFTIDIFFIFFSLKLQVLLIVKTILTEAHSDSGQTSKRKLFAKAVNYFRKKLHLTLMFGCDLNTSKEFLKVDLN